MISAHWSSKKQVSTLIAKNHESTRRLIAVRFIRLGSIHALRQPKRLVHNTLRLSKRKGILNSFHCYHLIAIACNNDRQVLDYKPRKTDQVSRCFRFHDSPLVLRIENPMVRISGINKVHLVCSVLQMKTKTKNVYMQIRQMITSLLITEVFNLFG